MKLKLVLHSSGKGLKRFQLSGCTRPWGILLLISAGKYTLSFPQTGQTCTVMPNEITYIPPNMPFFRQIEEAIDHHQILFNVEQDHAFINALRPGKLPIPQAQVSAILRSLSLSIKMPQNPELALYELEHIIKENYLFSQSTFTSTLSDDISQVVSYMEQHLAEKITIETLAEQAFLSPTGLIWKFRQQLGTTPQQYLIMLRIRLAKELLLGADLSVAQIAEQCGYANAYYFSNAFHKHCGMSPTAFRGNQSGSIDGVR